MKTPIFKKTFWFFTGTLGWIVKIFLTIFSIGVVTVAICAAAFALYISNYIQPNIDNVSLEDLTLNETSFVYAYDANGDKVLLERLYSTENRIWVDYDHISENMVNALVAVEDSRFFTHKGVDWQRTIGAMINMIVPLRETFGGGSTITQQLIKNLTGDDDVTVRRKITEILRALEFEKTYSKEDILESYLNTIYFGSGAYGVEAAAQTYFGINAIDLSPAQAACLAAMISSPTHNNPRYYPENNESRRLLVLSLMHDQGMFKTETEYQIARNTKLEYWGGKNADSVQPAPKQSYYVDQVITDVIRDLMDTYGYTETAATKLVYNGGYSIYCNVDLEIQKMVDSVYENAENFPDTQSSQELQSAITIMDPYSGVVLAMSGGVGEKTVNRGWNRATMTRRSPGSSIKPLTVYAPGFEYGMITPVTVLDDSPFDEETMWPKNQNGYYSGRSNILNGVGRSLNTIAVKVLDMVTPERSFSFATLNLGLNLVSSMEKNDRVFSDIDYAPLALGGLTNGVTVLEMTAAYCSFVNEGIYTKPRTYSRVLDANGVVVLENEPKSNVAMKKETAFYVNQVLTYAVNYGTGARAKLGNGIATAGKTGTTTSDYDRWFCGYTPYYCAAVWVGYDRQAEIKLSTSVNPALAVWKQIMDMLHEGKESADFFDMETATVRICHDSGMLAGENCQHDARGGRVYSIQLLRRDIPTEKCEMHVDVEICNETGMRATPYCKETHTVSLIDVERTGNVKMSDNEYLYKEPVYADPYTGQSTESKFNTYCTVHDHEIIEPDPFDPDDDGSGIDNGPGGTENSDDSGNTGSGSLWDWLFH
ncbi:MAG: transglycosylase domain-containing protein [Oscillospiraceae bacterium]|nr:transglycosylase domain-containing protein [Oscillospiraceae bacterium]